MSRLGRPRTNNSPLTPPKSSTTRLPRNAPTPETSSNSATPRAECVNSRASRSQIPRDTDLRQFAIVIPPDDLVRAYERAIGPLLELVWSNSKQSESLALMGDALLPKLLSGEI